MARQQIVRGRCDTRRACLVTGRFEFETGLKLTWHGYEVGEKRAGFLGCKRVSGRKPLPQEFNGHRKAGGEGGARNKYILGCRVAGTGMLYAHPVPIILCIFRATAFSINSGRPLTSLTRLTREQSQEREGVSRKRRCKRRPQPTLTLGQNSDLDHGFRIDTAPVSW